MSQCRDYGYNFFEFTEILRYVRDNSFRESDQLEFLYKSLDKSNKGWVDKEEFAKVVVFSKAISTPCKVIINLCQFILFVILQKSVAKIAPNFSKTHSARIFDLLDSNATKVVWYLVLYCNFSTKRFIRYFCS